MKNVAEFIPKPTNCYLSISKISFSLQCCCKHNYPFLFFLRTSAYLGAIAALQECFGNSFCCGQQLPLQLGFSKEVSSICLTVLQQQNKANFCGNQIVAELPFM